MPQGAAALILPFEDQEHLKHHQAGFPVSFGVLIFVEKPSPSSARLVCVDVFRGVTIVWMLLVNNPGDPQNVFLPLRQSVRNGCTLADLAFPFFLFVLGITTQFTLSRRADSEDRKLFRTVLRRSLIIFGIGLLMNAYPFFDRAATAGPVWLPTILGHVAARLEAMRLTGVLQRIAISYFIVSLTVWKENTSRVLAITVLLLLWYWGTMTLVHVPGEGEMSVQVLNDPGSTFAAWFDRRLLDWTSWGGGWHMWDRAVPYDPEGVLSTVPSIATVLCGVLAGRWLQSPRSLNERLQKLGYAGVCTIAGGLLWSIVFPINKPLWTSSFVLFTVGIACVTLSMIGWRLEITQSRRWMLPFLVFGTNPILAYVGSELLASVLRSSIKFKVDGHRIGSGMTVVRALVASGVETRVASLIWAVLFAVLCYFMLAPLYRRRIFLRV